MTIVAHYNSHGCKLAEIVLSDDDATTEAIALAAIDVIRSSMSLHEGDRITIETA